MSDKTPSSLMSLECSIQHYDWGSIEAIPRLLGLSADGQPWAEMWMGAHPRGPSRHGGKGLDEWIKYYPEQMLGTETATRVGRMPFLFKILAAAQPLSIQAHPNKIQAEDGFDREEQEGIELDAFDRSYKDRSDKPELVVALEPFEVLCGFRKSTDIANELRERGIHALSSLTQTLDCGKLKQFSEELLHVDASTKVKALAELRLSLNTSQSSALLTTLVERYPEDIGVFAGIFLNHITLKAGQGLFLEPGVLHAYLRGSALELMANSDNVLRAGLTPKYVDTAELMRVGVFKAGALPILEPNTNVDGWRGYPTPLAAFELWTTALSQQEQRLSESPGPQILLCLEGEAEVQAPDCSGSVIPRHPLFIAANTPIEIRGSGQCFVARTRCV